MNEFSLIEKYLSPLSKNHKGAFSLKDDAAVVSHTPGFELVVTKDIMVERVHFFKNSNPMLLARKLVRVNLSDLAAKGAEPKYYMLGLTLPENIDEAWLREFAKGLALEQKKYRISLIGGDTTAHAGGLVLSLTMFGEVKKNTMLKRSGAKKGDEVFVTGTIGDAYLGLQILSKKLPHDEFLVERYHLPEPRVAFGLVMKNLATASADISDGLAADLLHICEASNVGAEIYLEKIPLSKSAKKFPSLLKEMITGGDDYELVFTAPKKNENKILEAAKKTNTLVTKIGAITQKSGFKILNIYDENGKKVKIVKPGFQHF